MKCHYRRGPVLLRACAGSDGPICPKCGAERPYTITRAKSKTKNTIRSLYKCRACKRQFTVTVGTIFEDSPLNMDGRDGFLMCA